MPLKQGTEKSMLVTYYFTSFSYKKDAPKAGDGNHYLPLIKSATSIKKMPLKQGTEISRTINLIQNPHIKKMPLKQGTEQASPVRGGACEAGGEVCTK